MQKNPHSQGAVQAPFWETQHHSLELNGEFYDEESTEVTDVDVNTLSNVVDGVLTSTHFQM
mgnify:CR=1 FL=1